MNVIVIILIAAIFSDGTVQSEHSVLHPNIKVIPIDRDPSGQLVYDTWSPSANHQASRKALQSAVVSQITLWKWPVDPMIVNRPT